MTYLPHYKPQLKVNYFKWVNLQVGFLNVGNPSSHLVLFSGESHWFPVRYYIHVTFIVNCQKTVICSTWSVIGMPSFGTKVEFSVSQLHAGHNLLVNMCMTTQCQSKWSHHFCIWHMADLIQLVQTKLIIKSSTYFKQENTPLMCQTFDIQFK